MPRWARAVALLVLAAGLTTFYATAAAEHGRRINTSKARGDQSGYLFDAENVYANWHGRRPPTVIGERNRMPVYAGYLALFEYAPDGIVIADRERHYLDANPSICRMLGYSLDELVGLSAADIVVQEEVQHIGPALAAITSRADYHREWRFRRKDGSVFSADVIATTARWKPDGDDPRHTERNQAITERHTLRSSFSRRRRWRPSDGWPAAWRTISTTSDRDPGFL